MAEILILLSILIFLGACVVVIIATIKFVSYLLDKKPKNTSKQSQANSSTRTNSTQTTYRPSPSRPVSPSQAPNAPIVSSKSESNTYRPSDKTGRQSKLSIPFKVIENNSESPLDLDIKDLVDALTGAPLQIQLGLYQCQRCKVFYQAQSYRVIQEVNEGKCVSCAQKQIINVAERKQQRGHNADVNVITLENYRDYVGNVITFEGHVFEVKTSRRGIDYAVMFENKSWSNGLKMVVFPDRLHSMGGYEFLKSLEGHKVRVRGLLKLHEKYGYQIVVSDHAMILGVQ